MHLWQSDKLHFSLQELNRAEYQAKARDTSSKYFFRLTEFLGALSTLMKNCI